MKFSTVALPLLAAASAIGAALPSKNGTEELAARAATYSGGQMTWYSGSSLNNPACGGKWPSDNSLAIAVPYSSPAKCNQWVKLSYKGKSVSAKVVDRCGDCGHLDVDATKRVFRALAPLSVGRLYNIKMSM